MEDDHCSVTSQSILVPSDQVVDRSLSLLLFKFTLDNLSIPQLLILNDLSSFCSLPLYAMPVLERLSMLLLKVLLRLGQFSFLFDFKGDLDNVQTELFVLLVLRFFYHDAQVLKVLLIRLEVCDHGPLWRHFGLIKAPNLTI